MDGYYFTSILVIGFIYLLFLMLFLTQVQFLATHSCLFKCVYVGLCVNLRFGCKEKVNSCVFVLSCEALCVPFIC